MASTERRKPSPPLKETSYNLATRRFLLRPSWYIEDILCGLQLGIAHFLIVFFTYSVVPEPYMDEIFHIRQTRRYCKGDFSWDPMITTPPALYFLALPFCKYGLERYVNTFLIILLYIGCCRFRRLFTRSHIKLTSLVVCLLPVLLHTAVLFYTDVLSLCAVVWAFTLGTSNAAVCFLIACCARQTNIVWAGFYALVRMYHHYDEVRPIRGLFKSTLKLWPFLLLATGFLAFLILNGGIVLGDPKAHQAKPHFAQLLYFLAFAAAHSSPQALPFIGELVAGCFTKLYAGLCLLFVVIAKYFTYDHPYLLADNRHVPFYLWRWFLRHESIRLAVTPIYAAAALFLLKMSSTIPRLIQVLFIAATAATLVPAHLIEPRYFIIPYVLWRLSASPTPIRCIIIIEILLNFGVFSWYFYLFLYRPFEWSHEPGTQRFMW